MVIGMGALPKSRFYLYFLEVSKWAVIIWLLLPLKNALHGPAEFGRIALGVVLFVVFSGKLLYDAVFFPRQHKKASPAGKDLLSMLGIVVGIALIVSVLVFFVAVFVIESMNTSRF